MLYSLGIKKSGFGVTSPHVEYVGVAQAVIDERREQRRIPGRKYLWLASLSQLSLFDRRQR